MEENEKRKESERDSEKSENKQKSEKKTYGLKEMRERQFYNE